MKPQAKQQADILQDLVQVARDSKSFYDSAAKAVDKPKVKAEFQRMSDAKGELISALSVHISARGERPDTGGTFAGTMRKAYGEMLAALGRKDHAAYTYAAQLEETEDRLLKHFERAMGESDSPQGREGLMAQLPKIRQCHEEMERLKIALAA